MQNHWHRSHWRLPDGFVWNILEPPIWPIWLAFVVIWTWHAHKSCRARMMWEMVRAALASVTPLDLTWIQTGNAIPMGLFSMMFGFPQADQADHYHLCLDFHHLLQVPFIGVSIKFNEDRTKDFTNGPPYFFFKLLLGKAMAFGCGLRPKNRPSLAVLDDGQISAIHLFFT